MGINHHNNEGYPDPTAFEAIKNIEKEKKYRSLVFICSPYAGDIYKNIENAKKYARFAIFKGKVPIIPHLMYPQFLDENDPAERKLGIEMGLILLTKCKELWFFGNQISKGMEIEIEKARERSMIIKHYTDTVNSEGKGNNLNEQYMLCE